VDHKADSADHKVDQETLADQVTSDQQVDQVTSDHKADSADHKVDQETLDHKAA
jgi:hypothetical protein